MKKIQKMLLTAGLCMLCFCGCGVDTDETETDGPDKAISADAERALPTEDAKEPSKAEAEDGCGAETYRVELDLSDSKRPEVCKVVLSGEIDEAAALENLYERDVLATGLVGLFGCPIGVKYEGEGALLSFEINEKNTQKVPLENLIVLYYDEEQADYILIESSLSGNVVSAEIAESGTYLLADIYEWGSAWGWDVENYAHDMVLENEEFGFAVTLPEGIACSTVSADWEDDSYGMMEKELIYQFGGSTNMIVSLFASRFPNEEDNCPNPQPMQSLGQTVDEICTMLTESESLSAEASYEDFSVSEDGRKGYILTVHFPDDAESGIYEQSQVYGYFEYSEDTFIVLNYWISGADEELLKKAEESVRSFQYREKEA